MDWRTAAVLLAVVTAGCGGLVGPSPPPETVTPAAVPDVPTATPVPDQVAPGVGARGTVDAERLAGAHGTAVRNRSYTWREELRTSVVGGSERLAVRSHLRVETPHRYLYRSSVTRGGPTHAEFADGTTRYQRTFAPGGVRVVERPLRPASDLYAALATGPIRQYLAVDEARVARASGDGAVVVTATPDAVDGLGRVENYSVVARVEPDGFVRSLRASFATVRDGQRTRVRYHMRYAAVGNTTVERPPWVDAGAS